MVDSWTAKGVNARFEADVHRLPEKSGQVMVSTG
jgi:hypothetical protein